MKNRLLYNAKLAMLSITLLLLNACGKDDEYTGVPEAVSPVVMDLDAIPYTNLSEYNFYEGDIKNLNPVHKVTPYDLSSSLFTDYALKKRFVWMPDSVTATYTTDGEIFNFPVGTALIKNFYYTTLLPDNTTKIIETRVMIRKAEGWIFAEYIWNDDQTDAVLTTERTSIDIEWMQNGEAKSTTYITPSNEDCASCHMRYENNTPIGVKPQNINKMYAYSNGSANQLDKWIELGYLDNKPDEIVSIVDWKDTSQPIETRVRSYLDINCAHCHSLGTSCDYTPMELSFSQSDIASNLGVCIEPVDFVSGNQQYIVAGQDVRGSLLHFRMNTNIRSEMMPTLGRTLIDEEAVELVKDWIVEYETQCP